MYTKLCRPFIYKMMAAIMMLNIALSWVLPVEIDFEAYYFKALFGSLVALLMIAIVRLYPDPRCAPVTLRAFGYVLEGLLLIIMMMASLRVMDHVSKAFAPPYADSWLSRADELLHLNWLAYFEFIHDRPFLHPILGNAYIKLEMVTILAIVALLVFRRLDRARLLLESFIICAVISISFGAIFPAKAAVAVLIPDLAAYPNFANPPGVYHLDALEALRDPATVVSIGRDHLTGLVTFPSLHTANGILLIVACWRTPLFLPSVIYGLMMIPATPIWGGHYFIDLIAGTVMAIVVALVLARQPYYAGVWAPTRLIPDWLRPSRPTMPVHA